MADCPTIEWRGIDNPTAKIEFVCEQDGNVLLLIEFEFHNSSPNIIQPRVEPGPGGAVVGANAPFGTPNAIWTVSVVVRYDPVATPNPAPFIQYIALADNMPLDCPTTPIPLPNMPDCRGDCPSMIVFEVRNADGDLVNYGPSGPNCLPKGQYEVCIASPVIAPNTTVVWSIGNGQVPGAADACLTVDLDAGPTNIAVTVLTDGCPPIPGGLVLNGCVTNCDETLSLYVVDGNNQQVIDPEDDCIDAGVYTVHATGPSDPPWNFEWSLNGIVDPNHTGTTFPLTIAEGGAATVEVRASTPGCENDLVRTLGLTGCRIPPWYCGILMIAIAVALGLALVGTLTLLVLSGCLKVSIGGTEYGVVIGLWIAFGLLVGISYLFCDDDDGCPCLSACDWLQIGWMSTAIAGFFAIYLGKCCEGWWWFVVAGLVLAALGLFYKWVDDCKPTRCVIIAALLVVFATIFGSAISFIGLEVAGVEIFEILKPCTRSWVATTIGIITAILTLLNYACKEKPNAPDNSVATDE